MYGKEKERMKKEKAKQVICAAALTAAVMLTGQEADAAEQMNNEAASEGQAVVAMAEVPDLESITEEVYDEETDETEISEEIEEVITEGGTESEEEVILEPEYSPEQDPAPLSGNVRKSFEVKDPGQIHHVELSDPEWIAIDGEKATCTSFAKIQYGYTPEVQVGTIRYISQIAGSGLFDWSYWGGWGNQAGIECGTASISMALSYVGVNLTPQEILDAHGGLTSFTGWGVADLSPDVAGGMEQYINGRGQYSPVIVHLPTYSQLGHYVVLIGKLSESEYLVLDCAQNETWVMTVGDGFYNSIDQVYQYYNPNAEMLDHTQVTDKPVLATCTRMGLTAGKHCEVCEEVLEEQHVVPCNGHAWSKWITETEPTTKQTGEKMRICQVCGEKDIRSIEKLPENLVIELPEDIWNNVTLTYK